MRRFVCLAAVVVFATAPAFAQQRGRGQGRAGFRPTDPVVKALDVDADGSLSDAELKNASERILTLDTDGNGSVDMTEIRNAMRAAMRGRLSNPGARGGGPGGNGGSSSLQRTGLKLGQSVPDIVIHDASGGEFRMADLRGKYSVIVFGCLT